jgi:hypothetical protein
MSISQLPQTPNVGPEVPQSLWKWLIELGNRIRSLIDWVNSYTAPTGVTAHASTHASGGSDPVSPQSIGAAPVVHKTNHSIGGSDALTPSDIGAASIGGNTGQTFNVANATAETHAIALGQFAGTFATSGYRILPDGTIIQWGVTTIPSSAAYTLTFPLAFPTECYNVQLTFSFGAGWSVLQVYSFTSSTATLYQSANQPSRIYWQAIGK